MCKGAVKREFFSFRYFKIGRNAVEEKPLDWKEILLEAKLYVSSLDDLTYAN